MGLLLARRLVGRVYLLTQLHHLLPKDRFLRVVDTNQVTHPPSKIIQQILCIGFVRSGNLHC